jgi:antitoxin MazE
MMRVILKVYKKGIIVLPKRLREILGINEGDMIVAEVMGDKLVMRALKPKVVDVDPKIVEEILREEYELEKNKYTRMISGEETSS